MNSHMVRWLASFFGVFGALVLTTSKGHAAVQFEGTWPQEEPPISLRVDALPRADVVKKIADLAGWSIVLDLDNASPVTLDIRKQSPAKVLDVVLGEGNIIAKREGDLVVIRSQPSTGVATVAKAATPQPSASGVSPEGASPTSDTNAQTTPQDRKREGGDRTVFGDSVTVGKDEVVKDLTVFGGTVSVYGRVTGDLTVLGGLTHLYSGAHVDGDVSQLGGSLEIDETAFVGRDVSLVGGHFDDHRPDASAPKKNFKFKKDIDLGEHSEAPEPAGRSFMRQLGSFSTKTALLFVFGAVLLALAPDRMEKLKVEVAARSMRSLALGLVGALTASVVLIALTVTIIGIPFALIGACLIPLAIFVGISATLVTFGEAVTGHRTKNPYMHLVFRASHFMVVGYVPVVGTFAQLAVAFVGIGALVATRAAGFIPDRRRPVSAYPV